MKTKRRVSRNPMKLTERELEKRNELLRAQARYCGEGKDPFDEDAEEARVSRTNDIGGKE
ncbi:MAG: hypothetical protein ABSG63_14185 [Spirochaetia bacterium]|jgi:hypothetical protein